VERFDRGHHRDPESGVDVVAVQELSPRWRLPRAAGICQRVSVSHRGSAKGCFGAGIYARELLDADILLTAST
jgi:hypothetical protein